MCVCVCACVRVCVGKRRYGKQALLPGRAGVTVIIRRVGGLAKGEGPWEAGVACVSVSVSVSVSVCLSSEGPSEKETLKREKKEGPRERERGTGESGTEETGK